MVIDPETVLVRKPLLCPAQELHLIINEVRIIDHPLAPCTNKMMVMMCTLWTFGQLITGFTVAKVELENQPQTDQHIQRSIDRRQPNIGIFIMNTGVHILGAQMIVG